MSLKQHLLENTNKAMLSWIQQERANQQPIPLAVFKSKAIRVYRDLKTNLHLADDGHLGTLKADRKWFLSFLQRYPVRYDTIDETLVTLKETAGRQGPKDRFVIRRVDLQFIFDESGESSEEEEDVDDDDDVIIVEPDSPPPPLPPVPVQKPRPTPPPPVAAHRAHAAPSPLSLATQRSRRQITPKSVRVEAPPPPSLAASRTPRQSATAAALSKTLPASLTITKYKGPPPPIKPAAAGKAQPTVPPLKIKLNPTRPLKRSAQTPPVPVAAVATPPPKKVKMVSRIIQVNMEPLPTPGRVFKNDNLPIRRRITAIERVQSLRAFLKTQDKNAERLKLVAQYLDQVVGLYNVNDGALRAHQEKRQKRLKQLAVEREKKKKRLKEEEEEERRTKMVKIKRSRSPTPPPAMDFSLLGNGDATGMVQCVLNGTEEVAQQQPVRVRIKREPKENGQRVGVRIKAEPKEKEKTAVVSIPVRIKRERVEVKQERGIKRERVELNDFPTITAVTGDVPMSMLTGDGGLEGGEDGGMTIAAVNGGVEMPGETNAEGGESLEAMVTADGGEEQQGGGRRDESGGENGEEAGVAGGGEPVEDHSSATTTTATDGIVDGGEKQMTNETQSVEKETAVAGEAVELPVPEGGANDAAEVDIPPPPPVDAAAACEKDTPMIVDAVGGVAVDYEQMETEAGEVGLGGDSNNNAVDAAVGQLEETLVAPDNADEQLSAEESLPVISMAETVEEEVSQNDDVAAATVADLPEPAEVAENDDPDVVEIVPHADVIVIDEEEEEEEEDVIMLPDDEQERGEAPILIDDDEEEEQLPPVAVVAEEVPVEAPVVPGEEEETPKEVAEEVSLPSEPEAEPSDEQVLQTTDVPEVTTEEKVDEEISPPSEPETDTPDVPEETEAVSPTPEQEPDQEPEPKPMIDEDETSNIIISSVVTATEEQEEGEVHLPEADDASNTCAEESKGEEEEKEPNEELPSTTNAAEEMTAEEEEVEEGSTEKEEQLLPRNEERQDEIGEVSEPQVDDMPNGAATTCDEEEGEQEHAVKRIKLDTGDAQNPAEGP